VLDVPIFHLTLNLLTTTIVALPSNASKWLMGFNSAFKGLILITGLCAFQINMSFTCVVWQRESEIWRDLFRQDACKGTELFVYLNIYLCFVIPTPYTYFS